MTTIAEIVWSKHPELYARICCRFGVDPIQTLDWRELRELERLMKEPPGRGK